MRKNLHIGIWLFSLWFMASPLWAQTYDKGLEAFELGEYSKAYKALGKAEKKTKDKGDKAKILALMAASSLKMGKSAKAKKLFGRALKLDPEVELDSLVAKDKKVKKMFAAAKDDAGGDDEGDSEDGDEDDRKDKKKKGKKSSVSPITYVLPFGINEFMQDKLVPAAIFGAGQAGGLFFFVYSKSEADKADSAAAQAITNAKAAGKENDAEFLKYLDENEAYVNSSRQQATIGLALFGVSYAVSVLDAAFGFLGDGGKSSASLESDRGGLKVAGMQTTLEVPTLKSWEYDLMLLPGPTHLPVLTLSLKTEF